MNTVIQSVPYCILQSNGEMARREVWAVRIDFFRESCIILERETNRVPQRTVMKDGESKVWKETKIFRMKS